MFPDTSLCPELREGLHRVEEVEGVTSGFRRLACPSIWRKRHTEELSNKLVEIKILGKKSCFSKLQFLVIVFICIVFLLHPLLSFAFSEQGEEIKGQNHVANDSNRISAYIS